MKFENIKSKIRREKYIAKQIFHLLFSNVYVRAKNTNVDQELEHIVGNKIGNIFDHEIGGDYYLDENNKARLYTVYYNPNINQIITFSIVNDYVLINFYAGLKLRSTNMKYIEARQIFENFVKELDVDNYKVPVIPTETRYYAFFKVMSEEFILYPDQREYIDTFKFLCEQSKTMFETLVYSFTEKFSFDFFKADDYRLLIKPRNNLNKGRVIPLKKNDDMVQEIKNMFSQLGFEPTHFININGNLMLGKSRIKSKNISTGVYISPIDNKNKRIEVKAMFILKYTIKAIEEEFHVAKKTNVFSPGMGAVKMNTADGHRPKKTTIDTQFLIKVLDDFTNSIVKRAKPIADIEIIRETVPNDETKFRFNFQVIVKQINNYKRDDDGRFYVIALEQAIKNINVIVNTIAKKYQNEGLIEIEDTTSIIDEDLYEDPLLKMKRFEFYLGAYAQTKKVDIEQ